MKNIFYIDNNIPKLAEALTSISDNIIYTFDNGEITNEELKQTKCQYLIVRSTIKVNEKLLKNTNVRFVATATTGTEHIDINYLKTNNIDFFAATGANSNSVAEYVIYSILFYANQQQINDLTKLQVGIIGFGNIGTKVNNYLNQMNIKTKISDPFVQKLYPNIKFTQLNEIIDTCNIITTHTPLTTQNDSKEPTFNLLNANYINNIKDNTLIINAARGNIWDEDALIKNSKRLNIIIDTWINEPNVNRELIEKSILTTPHIAGHSANGKLNATMMIAKKLSKILKIKEQKLTEIIQLSYKQNTYSESLTNYQVLFNELSKAYNLLKTSNEMKQNANLKDEDFIKYFKNARVNYPERWELQPNLILENLK